LAVKFGDKISTEINEGDSFFIPENIELQIINKSYNEVVLNFVLVL